MTAPAALRDSVVITVNGRGARLCALARGERPAGRGLKVMRSGTFRVRI